MDLDILDLGLNFFLNKGHFFDRTKFGKLFSGFWQAFNVSKWGATSRFWLWVKAKYTLESL